VLLGTPIKDLDFVVEGDAPEVARQLAEELNVRAVVHARFGTATVVLGAGGIDLVTARREVYPRPAALPAVSPGSIYDDLARRDFSINALALPLAEDQPKVLDHHAGLDDLRRGVIRVLHPKSFADDPTRILRAVRYEGRFGFHLEDGTLNLLESAVAQDYLGLLTGDRLRHELARILQEDRPEPVLQRAWGLGVLDSIHPSLGDEEASARLAALAGSEAGTGGIEPLAYLGSLVYPLSGGAGEALISRLNLPATWAEVVRDTIRLRELEPELAVLDMERSRLFHLVQGFSQIAALAVSRVTASAPVAKRLSEYWNELRLVSPALSGGDLLAMGVPEGPLVGQVLRELQDARLDRRVATADDERRLVRRSLARLGGRPGDG
jgi:tRNA nucleotidyltransferase (CCA-adding enzyme)